ncbi:MAG: HAMP domain-containing sensor histidine kinase [Thermomicrobiales bacterium]
MRRLAPKTLQGRLAVAYSVLIVLMMAAFGGVVVVSVRNLYVDRLTDQIEAQARLVAEAVAPEFATGGNASSLDGVVKRLGRSGPPRITVTAADGSVVGESSGTSSFAGQKPMAPEAVRTFADAGGEGSAAKVSRLDGLLSVSVPVPGGNGATATVALPLDDVNAAVRKIQLSVAIATALAAFAATLVASVVARRISGPLTDLRLQAMNVADGQLDASVTPAATRELGDLARAFNAMTSRVRDLVGESEDARSRLEVIFSNLSDGVIIVDAGNEVAGLNAAAVGILGASATGAVGRPFSVVARDSDLIRLMRDAFASNAVRSTVIDYARSGRVFEASAQPVAGSAERLGIVVIRDVTELRRLELVRREFVANVSHELRTPLASIRALVETLDAGAIDDPTVSGDFLGRIVGEVDRLTALVDELLDLARLESGRLTLRLERVAPDALVMGAMDRLRPHVERARLTLLADVSPGMTPVLADRARIEQVLLNLMHNATKFTPVGGTIRVSARKVGDWLEIDVTDSGFGIPEADLPRVFERFFKSDKARRSDGTGLGLAIAKHIVQAHHGAIWARSAVGVGSTFTFSLPRAPQGDPSPDGSAADP